MPPSAVEETTTDPVAQFSLLEMPPSVDTGPVLYNTPTKTIQLPQQVVHKHKDKLPGFDATQEKRPAEPHEAQKQRNVKGFALFESAQKKVVISIYGHDTRLNAVLREIVNAYLGGKDGPLVEKAHIAALGGVVDKNEAVSLADGVWLEGGIFDAIVAILYPGNYTQNSSSRINIASTHDFDRVTKPYVHGQDPYMHLTDDAKISCGVMNETAVHWYTYAAVRSDSRGRIKLWIYDLYQDDDAEVQQLRVQGIEERLRQFIREAAIRSSSTR